MLASQMISSLFVVLSCIVNPSNLRMVARLQQMISLCNLNKQKILVQKRIIYQQDFISRLTIQHWQAWNKVMIILGDLLWVYLPT